MSNLRTAAKQMLDALEGGADSWQLVGPAIDALKAALAEPPVDDPHRDHWVAIAEAAQKIAASKECGLAEAKALCAALDRLTDAALAEPVQDKRTTITDLRCAKWLDPECAEKGACQSLKFKRSAEPVQEPVKQCMAHGECFGGECIYQRPAEPDSDSPERRCGGPGCDMTCCQPVQEPVAWLFTNLQSGDYDFCYQEDGHDHDREMWHKQPLYTAPPKRKPLAEWQINDLMADIDPEDRDSWSFRQGVYAAEKHHGVRK